MKKFLLTLAAVALAASAMMAQTNVSTATVEEPDRVQMKELSKNPTGRDVATGNMPMQQVKHECKDHKDGKVCDKPADQQCPDCKAKAAEGKKCEKGEGHECKEGMKDCKKGEGHECKEGMKDCKKGEGHECKEGMKDCKKGEGHECKKGEGPKHECKEGMKPECKKAEGKASMQKMERVNGPKSEFKKAESPKSEFKKGEGPKCEKAEGMKKHEECKDHKDGQPCTKPADQQCPDCKEKAAKKD